MSLIPQKIIASSRLVLVPCIVTYKLFLMHKFQQKKTFSGKNKKVIRNKFLITLGIRSRVFNVEFYIFLSTKL